MPLQGYSLSYNPKGSPEQKVIEHIHQTIMKLNPVKYLITHEHIDQISNGKDHLQIFYTLDNEYNTPACRITQKFGEYRKGGKAFHNKEHKKGSLIHGFGYCLKEVPQTGRILYTNLTEKEQAEAREFREAHKEDNTVIVSIPDQFFTWLKGSIYIPKDQIIERTDKDGNPVYVDRTDWEHIPDFKTYWDEFVCAHLDLTASRADYYKCSLNFRGKYRGYLILGFDSHSRDKK